jgi:hypothetical protein
MEVSAPALTPGVAFIVSGCPPLRLLAGVLVAQPGGTTGLKLWHIASFERSLTIEIISSHPDGDHLEARESR